MVPSLEPTLYIFHTRSPTYLIKLSLQKMNKWSLRRVGISTATIYLKTFTYVAEQITKIWAKIQNLEPSWSPKADQAKWGFRVFLHSDIQAGPLILFGQILSLSSNICVLTWINPHQALFLTMNYGLKSSARCCWFDTQSWWVGGSSGWYQRPLNFWLELCCGVLIFHSY